MIYRLLADFVVVLHVLFVLFAILGGLLLFKTRKAVWLHLPILLWALLIEWTGWFCPLTPLEIKLRRLGGEAGYSTDFVEHYIIPLLYPAELTRHNQTMLGLLLLAFNLLIYLFAWLHHQNRN